MAKNYFNRYVWLIDTINRHGYITLPEISRLWENSALNEEGGPLAESLRSPRPLRRERGAACPDRLCRQQTAQPAVIKFVMRNS